MIIDRLNTVSRNSIYSKVEEGKRFLVDDIFNTIKECNFFIDDLFGNISYSQWEVAHQICELSNDYNFSNEVIIFINDIDFKDDQSAKERYEFLIQNKLRSNSN